MSDGAASYTLAVAAMREERVRAGELQPINDRERRQRQQGPVSVRDLDCMKGTTMDDKTADLIRRLADGLSGCLRHLDAMALREAQIESGKQAPKTMDREKAEKAHHAVAEAWVVLGMEADDA